MFASWPIDPMGRMPAVRAAAKPCMAKTYMLSAEGESRSITPVCAPSSVSVIPVTSALIVASPLQFRLAHQPRKLDQPQGRITPQHGQDRVVLRPLAQLPQRLEDRQVRFPLARVRGALPPPDPPRTPGRTAGQKPIDHRRLANADVATDEDELARALGGVLEPVLQPRAGLLAPHDGARRQ